MGKYLLVAGDLFPTPNNFKLFSNGKSQDIIGNELQEIIKQSLYTVANLEGAITDSNEEIEKSGPALAAPLETINGIVEIGIDGLSLANNHILDYGYRGFSQTIKLLKEHKIDYWGAGDNIEEAKKPFIKEIDGKKIGFYSCSEYEFTIAGVDRCGANYFDELNICDDIQKLKAQVDYLIVLYHGMKELYRYPAPYIQKRCRKLVEKGANMVLCQHSHCIGCHEQYKTGQIVYGQGNFLFCLSEKQISQDGLIIKLDIENFEVSYIPVRQENNTIRILDSEEREKCMSDFWNRSEEIKKEGFIQENYKIFARNNLYWYDGLSLGRLTELLNRFHLSKLRGKMFKDRNRLGILNNLRCEAHRDLYITAIEDKLYKQE